MSSGQIEHSLTGIRVLVADPLESLRWLKAHLLRKRAAEVIEARTGQEALGILGTGGADIALLDTSLPDLSPAQMLATILANPATAAIPVVFTGDNDAEAPPGTEAFLRCPLSGDEMALVIRRLLSRRSSAAGS